LKHPETALGHGVAVLAHVAAHRAGHLLDVGFQLGPIEATRRADGGHRHDFQILELALELPHAVRVLHRVDHLVVEFLEVLADLVGGLDVVLVAGFCCWKKGMGSCCGTPVISPGS